MASVGHNELMPLSSQFKLRRRDSFRCYSILYCDIATNFCMCHNSCAVVWCAKICSISPLEFRWAQNEISISFKMMVLPNQWMSPMGYYPYVVRLVYHWLICWFYHWSWYNTDYWSRHNIYFLVTCIISNYCHMNIYQEPGLLRIFLDS